MEIVFFTDSGWDKDKEFQRFLNHHSRLGLVTNSEDIERMFWQARGEQNATIWSKPARSVCEPSLVGCRLPKQEESLEQYMDCAKAFALGRLRAFSVLAVQSQASCTLTLLQSRSFTIVESAEQGKGTTPARLNALANKAECVYLISTKQQGAALATSKVYALLVPTTLASWFWDLVMTEYEVALDAEIANLHTIPKTNAVGLASGFVTRALQDTLYKLLRANSAMIKEIQLSMHRGDRENELVHRLLNDTEEFPELLQHTLKSFPNLQRQDTTVESHDSQPRIVIAAGLAALLLLMICIFFFHNR